MLYESLPAKVRKAIEDARRAVCSDDGAELSTRSAALPSVEIDDVAVIVVRAGSEPAEHHRAALSWLVRRSPVRPRTHTIEVGEDRVTATSAASYAKAWKATTISPSKLPDALELFGSLGNKQIALAVGFRAEIVDLA